MSARSAGRWLGMICGILAWGHPFTALLVLVLMTQQRRLPTHDHDDLPTHDNDN